MTDTPDMNALGWEEHTGPASTPTGRRGKRGTDSVTAFRTIPAQYSALRRFDGVGGSPVIRISGSTTAILLARCQSFGSARG